MPPLALNDAPYAATQTHAGNSDTSTSAARVSWLVIAASFLIALIVVTASGVGIAVTSVGPLAILAILLVGVQIQYTHNRPDERIAATCGILAVLIAACLLAAIISHASLRFGYPNIDGALSKADLAIGIYAPAIVVETARYPSFSALLGLIYSTAMPLCIVMGLALAASGRKARAWEFAFSFTFCVLFAATVSIGFPALGSTVFHGVARVAGLPSSAGNFHMATVDYFRNAPAATFELARVQGIVTFPSFHMVMALLVPYALRKMGIAFWIAMIWALLVTLSSIVIGGHYVIDLLAGALIWAGSAWWIGPADRNPGSRA